MGKLKKPGASQALVVKTPEVTDTQKMADLNSATSLANLVVNGLSDAIFGYGAQTPGASLSKVDTLFYNMRWYLVSNMRQPLSEAYAEIGLVQTIVDIPVDDGLRGGVDIETKQLDEDEVRKLKNFMEEQGDLEVVAQANKWNRLFGGAGILVIADSPFETEFKIEQVKKGSTVKFRAVDLWELFWDKQNLEGDGDPLDNDEFTTYNYYSKKVHKTRVMILKGIQAPSFVRPRLRGWGLSIVESLIRSINQYLKASDLGFEVLDEFKLDIFKIKGLTQALMSPIGTQKIRERVALANQQKNFQNALTMDSEDDYVQKQLSWSGLGDAMAGIRAQVASDMRIPQAKLFGQQAAGFNSGEDDIENYNAMVESAVRTKVKFEILRIIKIRSMQLFGMVPDDLVITFKPLRVMSSTDEETVKTSKFNRVLQARQAGEITSLEFRDAVNRDSLLPIQLDTTPAALDMADEEASGDDGDGGEEDKGDDEGKDKGDKLANSFDESKHPRADDGKFGEGGGSAPAKKSEKPEKSEGAKASPKTFAGFETKPPERSGSKSDETAVMKGKPGMTGKPSKTPYASPKNSTCNLVGYVAFGKASAKMQQQLTEHVQSAEVLLSDLGIKLKTPLDFVCQNVTSEKSTVAEYIRIVGVNPRVNIKGKSSSGSSYNKSMMHEIGHAIDYAMNTERIPASHAHTRGHSGDDAKELQKLHGELAEIVGNSKYYTQADPKFARYLKNPTEMFARAFEVYSYGEGLRLVEEGKLPATFLEGFKPDVFKTKNEKAAELLDSTNELATRYKSAKAVGTEEARELASKIYEEWTQTRKQLDEVRKAEGSWSDVSEAEQKEYIEKISGVMKQIFSKDTIKNALESVDLAANSLGYDKASFEADGGVGQFDAYHERDLENIERTPDRDLVARAKAASLEAYGKDVWQFVFWFYKQHGGELK